MKKSTKEAIRTSVVLVLIAAAACAFWIYPLHEAGKIIVRPDSGEKLPADDWLKGADSFAITTEDNIVLVGKLTKCESPQGTVILLHGLWGDQTSQTEKVDAFKAVGLNVVTYDQRGYGRSGGKYRSGGYFETEDLQDVISQLDLTGRLVRPLIVFGEDQGGAAVLRLWGREKRIDFVTAENPIVDGRDWQKRVIAKKQLFAPDFTLPLIWWWMKQKSGYEISLEESDISSRFGAILSDSVMTAHMLTLASGDSAKIANPNLDELHSLGGEWIIFPSGQDKVEFKLAYNLGNGKWIFVEYAKKY